MSDPILQVTGLAKHFGGVVATDDLSFEVERGEIHAVIGPNGAGKTTLVAQLSGMLEPDRGTIEFDGVDITRARAPECSKLGLARSFQITSIFRDLTAVANVAMAIQSHAGHSFRFWRAAHRDLRIMEPAREVLARVGLGPRADVVAANLAHGEQRQLELAMVLATRPKLLLLDEPTAGMGPEESALVREFLTAMKGDYSILLIEHDMDTVFSVADRITVLVYGRAIASGTPEAIRSDEAVRNAYLGGEG